jgi:anthranilate synthase component I
VTLVGASPEPMVQLLDGRVISRPIAGTRKRGRTEEDDRRLAAELLEHPKEVAEHVMLVDLARNDVGRVVTFGTCEVDELMTLERYSHVMHLTSQVAGDLAEGKRPRSTCCGPRCPPARCRARPRCGRWRSSTSSSRSSAAPTPASSATSTSRATSTPPSPSVPWSSVTTASASVQAGAGIVADSVPDDEHLECQNKARALLVAVSR